MKFNLFKKKETSELPEKYKKLMMTLHKKYPNKHISIDAAHGYYNHSGGFYKIEYSVYVEDEEAHKYFKTFSEVERYVKYLCGA